MIHECIRLNLLIGVRYSLYNICECIRLNWLESVRYSSRNKWISEETHYATSVWVLFTDVKSGLVQVITGINPEAVKWGDDHYDHLLCPGLQPGPPSQTPGVLGLRYWSSEQGHVTSETRVASSCGGGGRRSSGPSSLMRSLYLSSLCL